MVHSKTRTVNLYTQNPQTYDCELAMAPKPEKRASVIHQSFLLTKINPHKITLIAEINENNNSF